MNESPTGPHSEESELVWDFFARTPQGVFVDVGANHPVHHNQTWFLEQQGWTGVLVELNPDFAKLLREQRPRSRTFELAVGAPAQVGEVEVELSNAHGQTTLRPDFDHQPSGRKVRVPLRTLDSVLAEAGVTQVDFLSLDIEECELDALAGCDLARWQVKLIVIEDFLHNSRKRDYLRARGYRLVRRTGFNNWFVPADSPYTLWNTSSPGEIFHLARKMWVSGPIIGARRERRRRRAATAKS